MLLKSKFSIFYFLTSCGTVALMVLRQFSDICGATYGPQVSENWPRTIRATVPQLYLDLNVELMKITVEIIETN